MSYFDNGETKTKSTTNGDKEYQSMNNTVQKQELSPNKGGPNGLASAAAS